MFEKILRTENVDPGGNQSHRLTWTFMSLWVQP